MNIIARYYKVVGPEFKGGWDIYLSQPPLCLKYINHKFIKSNYKRFLFVIP